MNPDISPYILISSFVSQQIYTWLYNHPEIKWVNKETVLELSTATSAILAVVVAWASGTLDEGIVRAAVDAAWNAFIGGIVPVALHEFIKFWSKIKPGLIERMKGKTVA